MECDVLSSEVVPGDILLLGQGSRIPADARIIEATDFSVNESILTGEANQVKKSSQPLGEHQGWHIADRNNMVFMGTTVASGSAVAVAAFTGEKTELGKISKMLNIEEKKTPLQDNMDEFGKQLSLFSIIAIAIIALLGVIQGKPIKEMFNIAVSLIVAAIPEGLPIAVTLTLALGVTRMAKRNAIVRKLPAVETLGATNVICVDKTGTLTQNRMTVVALYTNKVIRVMHEVDHPTKGSIAFFDEDSNTPATFDNALHAVLTTSLYCNNARFDEAGSLVYSTPTEGALLSLALKSHLKDDRSTTPRYEEIAFDSKHKYMGVKINTEQGMQYLVKGAPEVVLAMCKQNYLGEPIDKAATTEVLTRLSARALRVIAFAQGPELTQLSFVGFAGLMDPPRQGVREAINSAKATGVHVAMITGDSKETALAIASQLDLLGDSAQALSAHDVEKLSQEELQQHVKKTAVFYRMTPAHKMKIVGAYQANGSVVAMTGDGVNDAPALSMSNIGIAMGKGSDVCKEASEIILVDNNFTTIVSAIEQGKVIYNNIKNFLRFQLTTSIAAMGLIAVCSILDWPLPLNATQILWINIIMDGPPAQSLTYETYADVQRIPPRDPKAPLLSRRLIAKIGISSLIIVAGTLFAFLRDIPSDIGVPLSELNQTPLHSSTIAFTIFVFFQLFSAFNCRSLTHSVFQVGLLSNKVLLVTMGISVVVQLAVIYIPFFQLIFHTVSLSFFELIYCIVVSSLVWVVDEVIKMFQQYK